MPKLVRCDVETVVSQTIRGHDNGYRADHGHAGRELAHRTRDKDGKWGEWSVTASLTSGEFKKLADAIERAEEILIDEHPPKQMLPGDELIGSSGDPL